MNILETEAKVFTHHLVGQDASPQVIQIYKAAMASSKPDATAAKLLHFMVRHPFSIGFIDAGLVFHDSTSEARRHLYVLLAILEASTEYGDQFLPKNRNPFYIFIICYSGLRAAIKAVFGLILVKVMA